MPRIVFAGLRRRAKLGASAPTDQVPDQTCATPVEVLESNPGSARRYWELWLSDSYANINRTVAEPFVYRIPPPLVVSVDVDSRISLDKLASRSRAFVLFHPIHCATIRRVGRPLSHCWRFVPLASRMTFPEPAEPNGLAGNDRNRKNDESRSLRARRKIVRCSPYRQYEPGWIELAPVLSREEVPLYPFPMPRRACRLVWRLPPDRGTSEQSPMRSWKCLLRVSGQLKDAEVAADCPRTCYAKCATGTAQHGRVVSVPLVMALKAALPPPVHGITSECSRGCCKDDCACACRMAINKRRDWSASRPCKYLCYRWRFEEPVLRE